MLLKTPLFFPRLMMSVVMPTLLYSPFECQLSADDADRAGDRARVGEDAVGPHGDVVAPEAATSPMLTTKGFLTSSSSCHIRSLARALPPGLSTRSTIALTVASLFASRMALIIVSEPIADSPVRKSDWLLPVIIMPVA